MAKPKVDLINKTVKLKRMWFWVEIMRLKRFSFDFMINHTNTGYLLNSEKISKSLTRNTLHNIYDPTYFLNSNQQDSKLWKPRRLINKYWIFFNIVLNPLPISRYRKIRESVYLVTTELEFINVEKKAN